MFVGSEGFVKGRVHASGQSSRRRRASRFCHAALAKVRRLDGAATRQPRPLRAGAMKPTPAENGVIFHDAARAPASMAQTRPIHNLSCRAV